MILQDETYRVQSDGMGGLELKTILYMSQGYWVADDTGVTIEGALTRDGIKDALSLMEAQLGEVIGVWTNAGITYLDRAHHIMRKEVAIDLANVYNQIAIWDCENDKAINL